MPFVAYYAFADNPFVTKKCDTGELKPKPSTRMRDLILIESTFNVLVLLCKADMLWFDSLGNQIFNYFFLCFFVLQTVGFLDNEQAHKHWSSSIRSWTLFSTICMQRWYQRDFSVDDRTANVIDEQGRFLVFGEDAPASAMLHYGFWLVGILFVDYGAFIENSALQVLHIASFTVALLSGEFWHARLLTASHLFIVDATQFFRTGCTFQSWIIMPPEIAIPMKKLLPLINLVSLLGCSMCILTTVICGPTRLMCFAVDLTGPWRVM